MKVSIIFLLKLPRMFLSFKKWLHWPNLLHAFTLWLITVLISVLGVYTFPNYLYSSTSSSFTPSTDIPLLVYFFAISLQITFVFFLFIRILSFCPSSFSCFKSSCSCSSVLANSMLSSANLKLFRICPLMLMPVSDGIL